MNPAISRLVAWLAHWLWCRSRRLSPKEPDRKGTSNGANGLLLLLLCATGLLLSACKNDAPPPPPRMPDMAPVGDGMKTLAYALVGAAVVLTLGRMTRH